MLNVNNSICFTKKQFDIGISLDIVSWTNCTFYEYLDWSHDNLQLVFYNEIHC